MNRQLLKLYWKEFAAGSGCMDALDCERYLEARAIK
ncbi:hypothetical protein OKW24_004968 [Peribacillus simplex]|jgi:hypothetical protein|nr:hypothetical protein [Peribacillus simplex]SNT32504.1 hypothetical protein SAMN05444672_114106 [Bacillus sp. OK838]